MARTRFYVHVGSEVLVALTVGGSWSLVDHGKLVKIGYEARARFEGLIT